MLCHIFSRKTEQKAQEGKQSEKPTKKENKQAALTDNRASKEVGSYHVDEGGASWHGAIEMRPYIPCHAMT